MSLKVASTLLLARHLASRAFCHGISGKIPRATSLSLVHHPFATTGSAHSSLSRPGSNLVNWCTTMRRQLSAKAGDQSSEGQSQVQGQDSEIVKEIKALIEDKIRPVVQEDGGDLEFVSYEDKIVRVRLQGACTSCPSSSITLKSGVKNMLQYHIPEVQDVEQVLDEENE